MAAKLERGRVQRRVEPVATSQGSIQRFASAHLLATMSANEALAKIKCRRVWRRDRNEQVTAFDFIVVGIVGICDGIGIRSVVFVRVSISLAAWVDRRGRGDAVFGLVRRDVAANLVEVTPLRRRTRTATRYIVAFALIVTGSAVGGYADRLADLAACTRRRLGLCRPLAWRASSASRGVCSSLYWPSWCAGMTNLPRQDWWQNALLSPPLVKAALELKPWLPQRWARAG